MRRTTAGPFRLAAVLSAGAAGTKESSSDSSGILGSWLIPINPAGLLKQI